MISGAITAYQHETNLARNKGFVGNEIDPDRSCSVVIGSRLAAILEQSGSTTEWMQP
jgi:hypothetical protein